MFLYAVSQNRFNKTGLRNNITAILPHMYTDHTSCNPAWCASLRNPSDQQTRVLHSDDLRHELSILFTGKTTTAIGAVAFTS